MKFCKRFIFYVFLLPFLAFAAVPVVIEDPQILSYVDKKLPHEGILKQSKEGFLYIELPKEYILGLLPLISQSGFCPPPYFNQDKVGAHITVATTKEITDLNFPNVPYLGESIPFSIVNFSHVQLGNSSLGSEAYELIIDSPQIMEIRKKLGLSPKIKGYDFHITVAVKCK
ncbi:MAG: hypothetical protein HZB76_06080 [Chlamydiae bacterium]|nr:hypothetical protein [Chlamydiota bacterium]